MTLSRDELARLDRLRVLFLDAPGDGGCGDYWRDDADVAAYDRVLAARIGWKWDAALAECRDRGFARADDQVVVDFGCGSGIAARRFVHHFGAETVFCHDRSARAMTFAVAQLRAQATGVDVRPLREPGTVRPDVLLVSHVLGELDAAGLVLLRALIERSRRVLFVEPGTRRDARRLSSLRDELLATFQVVAPCPHHHRCPALLRENDWCHFFAAPPPMVFTDGDQVRIARALGIDARSLPYSFVALSRAPAPGPPPPHRVLGRPDVGKHTVKVQVCEGDALRVAAVHKRAEPTLWRALKKHAESVRTLPS